MGAGKLDDGVTIAGRYVLLEALGEGGFGEVWKARDQKLDRPVALKFMRPQLVGNASLRRRFERESRALAAIKHPNVVQVFDDGEWEGRPFVVLEFVDGGTLRDWLESHRKLRKGTPLEEVRALFVQVCEGVAAAHRVQIVHRDLKPENVLIEYDGEGRATAKVLDFGLARVGEGQSSVALQVGTYAYMSPEQAAEGSDAVGPASDVFSLGVMLVELLTGRVLPDENSKAPWERAVLAGKAPAALERLRGTRSDVSAGVWAVAERALASEAARRYANAAEMRRAVEQAWGGGSARPSVAPAAEPWGGHKGATPPMASVVQLPSVALLPATTSPPLHESGRDAEAVAPTSHVRRKQVVAAAIAAAAALGVGGVVFSLAGRSAGNANGAPPTTDADRESAPHLTREGARAAIMAHNEALAPTVDASSPVDVATQPVTAIIAPRAYVAGRGLRSRGNTGPTVRAAPPTVSGLLSPEAIRRVVLRNLGQVNRCYEEGLSTHPGITGRVVIRFVVGGTGTVMASNVADSSIPVPSVGECIVNAVRRWQFPPPEGGGVVTVNYPFNLQPADQ